MTQNDLNRAVARVTGETVSEIAHRGFQPLSTDKPDSLPADDLGAPYCPHHGQVSSPEPVAA